MASSALPKENRSKQKCALCRNHDIVVLKSGHKNCPYEKDHSCDRCEITKIRRTGGREEIRRKRKHDQAQVNDEQSASPKKIRKQQECRKCRNHNLIAASIGSHKKNCPKKKCICEACAVISELRHATKTENKSMRTKKASQVVITEEVHSVESGYISLSNSERVAPDSNHESRNQPIESRSFSTSTPSLISPGSENIASPQSETNLINNIYVTDLLDETFLDDFSTLFSDPIPLLNDISDAICDITQNIQVRNEFEMFLESYDGDL